MRSRLDAAVVGAGISGLSAAHRLHALGFRDVLVLEASGRVGGKVSAVEVAGRGSELLRQIRAGEFTGRCGVCTYKDLCGDSRSRALAASGIRSVRIPGCAFLP